MSYSTTSAVGTIQITFENLDEAKRALINLHTKVLEISNDPEFYNINAYWSIGPAKNALHDAFQNLKQCSKDFDNLVNTTVASLIKAGVAFQDADGNAVTYFNGTLRYPHHNVTVQGSSTAVAVNIRDAYDALLRWICVGAVFSDASGTYIDSSRNKTVPHVEVTAEVNYAAIGEIFIGRLDWVTGLYLEGGILDVGDTRMIMPVLPPIGLQLGPVLPAPLPVLFPGVLYEIPAASPNIVNMQEMLQANGITF